MTILSQLRIRTQVARLVYRVRSAWLARGLWRLAPWLVRGLVWYNPADVPVRQPRLVRVGD